MSTIRFSYIDDLVTDKPSVTCTGFKHSRSSWLPAELLTHRDIQFVLHLVARLPDLLA
jgi:hypothetical protein